MSGVTFAVYMLREPFVYICARGETRLFCDCKSGDCDDVLIWKSDFVMHDALLIIYISKIIIKSCLNIGCWFCRTWPFEHTGSGFILALMIYFFNDGILQFMTSDEEISRTREPFH